MPERKTFRKPPTKEPEKEPTGWPWEWMGVGMRKLAEAPPELFWSAKVTETKPMGFMGERLTAPTWGEEIQEQRALPWQQQLYYEAPFWGATMAIPGATWGRAALAPTVAKGGVIGKGAQVARVVLAPPAGFEWVIGKPASFVFGKPIKWGAGKITQVRMDREFKKWVAGKNLGDVFTKNKRLQGEVRRAFNEYQTGNTKTSQQILDHIGEAYPQFKQVVPKPIVDAPIIQPTPAVAKGTTNQMAQAHIIALEKALDSKSSLCLASSNGSTSGFTPRSSA